MWFGKAGSHIARLTRKASALSPRVMRLDCQVVSWFCQGEYLATAAAGIGGEKDVHANQHEPTADYRLSITGPTRMLLR